MFRVQAFLIALMAVSAAAFIPPSRGSTGLTKVNGFSNDYGWGQDVIRRKERDARAAERGDRIVEVVKPLGVILEEDKNGDVFVAEVTPGSNGAIAGLQAGERISMVSATFGDEMWSTQGAGMTRVQKAIKVRSGRTVKLVVQNEKEIKAKQKQASESAEVKAQRFLAEQAKRDKLLKEVEADRKQAAKGGFGVFKKNFGLWGDKED